MIKKILLSLGLIGFGLISFTNGQFIERGETVYLINNTSSSVVPILNGLTDIGNFYNKAIVSLWHNDYGNYSYLLFYHDNKIYFNHSLGNNSLNVQGYLNNWKICDLNENNYNNSNAVNCQGNYNTPVNLDDINQVDSIFVDYFIVGSSNNPSVLCLIDKSQNKSFCVGCNYLNCPSGYTPGNLIDITNYYDPDAVYELGEDIFNGGGGGGSDEIPENGFPNTNRGVFDAYAEQGYVLSRCYSDFSLDNLATATGGIYQFYETELDDGVYYTGATVLDLFVEYGYGNSFESFFDYWYQTYNQSLTNDSPLKYVGLSKGLWNMSNKYYYAGLSNKYVDYTKFYNYCSYFVDFDGDWDSQYTGPQLPDDVANQLAPSQSAIDYLSGFIHNQLSSGNNQNFDANTFFTSLTTKFDRLLNNINGSFVGIIPGYILAIMMALIFIRIISH